MKTTYKITAVAPTLYQSQSLNLFNLNNRKLGNGKIIGELFFDSLKEAQDYLKERALNFWINSNQPEDDYNDNLRQVEKYGSLALDAVTAYIEEVE